MSVRLLSNLALSLFELFRSHIFLESSRIEELVHSLNSLYVFLHITSKFRFNYSLV